MTIIDTGCLGLTQHTVAHLVYLWTYFLVSLRRVRCGWTTLLAQERRMHLISAPLRVGECQSAMV